jgi:hypothetical protein
VSYGFEPRLSVEMDFGAATCPATPSGPRTSNIKKSIAVLPMQLGTHVPNAHAQVFNAPAQGLHDVRASSAVNTCKACTHVDTVRLQYGVSTMDHMSGSATMPSDSTARRHTADRVQHDR